jgi:class 3 adenylate cyclase
LIAPDVECWLGKSGQAIHAKIHAMTSAKIERRLAAILAADVAGYSGLMGTDEVGTLNALKAHRRERVDPSIAGHNGRIVKTTGDGLLVEFASVVDAVGCAVAIQRAMVAFNAGIHVDRQVVFRIGINVGDIIIDGGDIFGDGVNVAARLEALCEPGGVCISRYANEQVRDKLSLTFADLGEQTVKNIARAVGVFGLAAKDIAALSEEALPEPEAPELRTPLMHARRRPIGAMVAGVIAVVAILAAGGWWTLARQDRATGRGRSSTGAPASCRLLPAGPASIGHRAAVREQQRGPHTGQHRRHHHPRCTRPHRAGQHRAAHPRRDRFCVPRQDVRPACDWARPRRAFCADRECPPAGRAPDRIGNPV